MEENKDKSIKYPYIPQDAVIKLEVSGFFINRMQKLVIALSNSMSKEELIKIFEQLKEDKDSSTVEAETLGILTTLLHDMEEQAHKQNKVKIMNTTHGELEKYFTNKGII